MSPVIANRPLEHWISGLESVENRRDAHGGNDFQLDFLSDLGQVPKVMRKGDSNHAGAYLRVWTSTESTDGKCSPIAVQ